MLILIEVSVCWKSLERSQDNTSAIIFPTSQHDTSPKLIALKRSHTDGPDELGTNHGRLSLHVRRPIPHAVYAGATMYKVHTRYVRYLHAGHPSISRAQKVCAIAGGCSTYQE